MRIIFITISTLLLNYGLLAADENNDSLNLIEENYSSGKKAVRIPSNIQRSVSPRISIPAQPRTKSVLCEALTDAQKPLDLVDLIISFAKDVCSSLKDANEENYGPKYRACTKKTFTALDALLNPCFAPPPNA